MFKLKSSTQRVSGAGASARASTGGNAEPLSDPAMERIANLWEFVYRGLYKAHPKLDASRLVLLNALCDGAGATIGDKSTSGPRLMGSLDKALSFGSRSSAHDGIEHLRVHRGNSQEIKDAVIETLEAYSREVESVDEIELALRERQVGFREPVEKDWQDTWADIKDRVESTGNKLIHYHVKVRILQLDIEKDAAVNELDQYDGWVVLRHILYPPVGRKTTSFSSSSAF